MGLLLALSGHGAAHVVMSALGHEAEVIEKYPLLPF
jgi:hypothetical protein